MSQTVIGVDLGATTIKAARVDPRGIVEARLTTATEPADGPEAVLARVARLVDQLCSVEPRPRAVGVGSCGLVDAAGRVVETTDTMPGWSGVDLPAELERRTGLTCVADNDGKVAALGEATLGAGFGARCVAMLTLGTGVGGGVVLDGRLLHGIASMAGMLGHIKVAAGGRRCSCGARGCLEAYASAWAFRRADGRDPHDVFAAAAAGERRAKRLVRSAGEALGRAIADIAHVLNPEVVVVGGGIVGGWQQLEATVGRSFRRAALPPAARSTQILPAALGPDAGILGAAQLAQQVVRR